MFYICMYVCMYVCVYVCMYICVLYMYVYVCMYVCMYVCIYVCMCVWPHECVVSLQTRLTVRVMCNGTDSNTIPHTMFITTLVYSTAILIYDLATPTGTHKCA